MRISDILWGKKDPTSKSFDLGSGELRSHSEISITYADRPLSGYERNLDFEASAIKNGSRILDLGSGEELSFASDLIALDKNLEIYCLSPCFGDKKYLEKAKNACPEANVVSAFGQKMDCFQDSIFDYVFCLHVIEHVSRRIFANILLEICRVLKPGGIARVGMIFNEQEYADISVIIDNDYFQKRISVLGVVVSVLRNKEESRKCIVHMIDTDFTSPKMSIDVNERYILIHKAE